MASLSSPKAGSRAVRGKSEDVSMEFVGVVCEARRLVREAERSGVVGREGTLLERAEVLRLWAELDSGRGVTTVVDILSRFPKMLSWFGRLLWLYAGEVEVEAGRRVCFLGDIG